jgi:hypothetical protein
MPDSTTGLLTDAERLATVGERRLALKRLRKAHRAGDFVRAAEVVRDYQRWSRVVYAALEEVASVERWADELMEDA